MKNRRMRAIAKGMLRKYTPIEDYREEYGLWVKREDLACRPPGPPFSKTRGVYSHLEKRPEKLIGVLDTAHSQAGIAVARACQILDKECINFYPVYLREGTLENHELREYQQAAKKLGARLQPLQAGRSAILFHAARKACEWNGGYMMPNALKLPESVTETASEVLPEYCGKFARVIIPASSATIAAGVIKGFLAHSAPWEMPEFIIHLGYSRSHDEVRSYLDKQVGGPTCKLDVTIIDQKYSYKDKAKEGETPPWPCNEYYDLKAFRWWIKQGRKQYKLDHTLFWNIG